MHVLISGWCECYLIVHKRLGRIFADAIKEFEMGRLSWIMWVGYVLVHSHTAIEKKKKDRSSCYYENGTKREDPPPGSYYLPPGPNSSIRDYNSTRDLSRDTSKPSQALNTIITCIFLRGRWEILPTAEEEAAIGMMWLQTKEFQGPPKAGENREQNLHQKKYSPADTLTRPSGPVSDFWPPEL